MEPHAHPSPAFLSALRRLLRPLVRSLVSQGIGLSYFTQMLKAVFVEAAEDFKVEGKRLTDSRISLLTGVHRKDVRKLREEPSDLPELSKHASVAAQAIALWTGSDHFTDSRGEPRPLDRHGPYSFDTLIETISKDMRPRTVLDEWLRRDIATIDDDGCVHLNAAGFTPSRDYDDLAYYMGLNLHDHIAATMHNIEEQQPPFLERSTHYTGLSAQSVAELEDLARQIGMEALVRINKEARRRAENDAQASDADRRFTFGIYSYHTKTK